MTLRRLLRVAASLLGLAAAVFAVSAVGVLDDDASAMGTTITVDSTADFDGGENRDTCTYTVSSGAITRAAPDGICTLRRAVLEASRRPDSDRPILIEFNIPETDPNYDASLDIWEIQIDESDPWELTRPDVLSQGGDVTIAGSTQPGGRTDGPKIMINTNRDDNQLGGRTFEVRTSGNVFEDLGFHGGGAIYLYEANNLVQRIWMGLNNAGTEMQPATTVPAGLDDLARGGIILPNSASDNNIIRDNVVIGAVERSIRVTSGGSFNQITGNYVGTNAAGEVPISGTIDCTRNTIYIPGLWYGGRGIQVTGSDNLVSGNVIAGLHSPQSTNDTPPISLEIFGNRNQVTGNTIGIDADGNKVGTCGQGLLFGGSASSATGNEFFFTRNGFDPSDIGSLFDSTIITQSFTGTGAGDYLEVYDNVIDGGDNEEANYYANRFADPGIPEVIRKFNPAKVTAVNGTDVSGTNGDEDLMKGVTSACPDCTIYLYADDTDDRIEAFELLGTASADGNGDWSTTLSRPLAADEGLRTQSQSTTSGVIGSSGPRMTSHLSDDLFPLAEPDVFCNDKVVTINMQTNGGNGIGTDGDDVILGTDGPDVIDAMAGNDTVCGLEGDDVIQGNAGDDYIDGAGGADKLFGAQGADVMLGGDDDDVLHGNRGDDVLMGGDGDDKIFGYANNDTISGGDGDDRLHGNFGNDVMFGGEGDDRMFGYGDNDILDLGPGNDLAGGNFGDDEISGGDGDDIIYGSDGADTVNGNAGNDALEGNSGSDIVNGGLGNDTMDGGINPDTCNGGPGTDTATRCETITGVP